MVLSEFLGAFLRRWYVALVGLAVTAGLGVLAATGTPPVYRADGLVLLLPSRQAVGEGGNPFLGLGGLDQPARIVVAYLNSASTVADVAAVHPNATYRVTIDDSTRGPVIALEASDSTPESTLVLLRQLADAVPATLERLQAQVGAPPESAVTSMPLTMDTEAQRDTGTADRLLIAAVVVGLALTALAVSAVDGVMRRRHPERNGSPPSGRRIQQATLVDEPLTPVASLGEPHRLPATSRRAH